MPLSARSSKAWASWYRHFVLERRLWVLALVSAAAIASCKDATQAVVIVRSNVTFQPGNGMALWASRSGAVNEPLVQSAEPWLADGELGDVVVVPGEAPKESPLTLRVAMGLRGKRAAACTDGADPTDCIVARRRLSFVPHARLRVPIVMYLACEGVQCDEQSTCSHLGQCVSAQVDPRACASAEGCTLPGEPPFVPGVVGSDAGPDAARFEGGVDAGDTDTGAPPPEGPPLVAGDGYTCAQLGDGTVKCWGRNDFGQLGLGDNDKRGDAANQMGANLPVVNLGSGRTTVELAAGYRHTCARLDDGTAKCWGRNNSGQLGLGDTVDRGNAPNQMAANLPVVNLGPGRSVVQLAAGSEHTCARLDDGTAKCWGRNNFGQLGLGDTADRGNAPNEMGANLPPVNLGPGRTVVQLAADDDHSCARLDNGTVKCWGRNNLGQLGLGDATDRGTAPSQMGAGLPIVDLGPGRLATQISAADDHNCARLDDGTVKCWGRNNFGQLGLGDTQSRGNGPNQMGANLPTVNLGPGRTAIRVVAEDNHNCAQLDDRTVKCWGRNNFGQLGLGDTLERGSGPNQMGPSLPVLSFGAGRTATRLGIGTQHTCARLDDGTVKCWGSNYAGQLGLGDPLDRSNAPAALPPVQLN